MKKSDIFLIIFIAAAGVTIAYFLCGALMEEIKPVSFKTVGTVNVQLNEPDPEVFNSAALNPTVETYVGSCVDQNQDGELDFAESVLCQEKVPGTEEEEEAEDELQVLLEQTQEVVNEAIEEGGLDGTTE